MARAVDADELKRTIESFAGMLNPAGGFLVRQDAVLRAIELAPTIEAEPVKHGKWVVTHIPDVFQCDYCKKATKMDELCDSEILRAYCPNCGARMDGE